MTNDQVVFGAKSIEDQVPTEKVATFATMGPVGSQNSKKALTDVPESSITYESETAKQSLFGLDLSSLTFTLEGMFLPSPDTNLPFEPILGSWETTFYQYLLLPFSEFFELLENLPKSDESEDFLDIAWEKLFDIPLDPSMDAYKVVTIAQNKGAVSSLAISLGLSKDGSLFHTQNDIVQSVSQSSDELPGASTQIPKSTVLVPVVTEPDEPVPSAPSFFGDPNYFFTTTTLSGAAKQYLNMLLFNIPSELNQLYLNTYSAIQLQGNLFSTTFNGDPDAAYMIGADLGQVSASLSALNIVGGSVINTANSTILTTAEGNTFELFTSGSRTGEFVYTINHAINPTADFASLPSLSTLFGSVDITLDEFLYGIQNSFGNSSVGTLSFFVINDKPVANDQGYNPSLLVAVNESNIVVPELVAGSLITPFVSNGILVISPDSTITPVTPSAATQINPTANGSYFGANGGFVSGVSLEGVTNAAPISAVSTTMTTFTSSDLLYLQSQGFTTGNGYKLSTLSDPVIRIQDSLGNILLVDTVTSQYIYKLNASFANTSPNSSILPGMNNPAIVNFEFTLTDHQGQSATAQLGITVHDDAPLVSSSSGSVYESGLPNGSGELPTTTVLTGDFGTFGADGFNLTNPISVSLSTIGATETATAALFSGALTPQFITIGSDAGVRVTDSINGNSLVINLNTLEYTYTLSQPLLFTTSTATQTFSIVFADSDGSTANATFVVTINDDPPVLDNAGSSVTYISGVTTEILLESGITLSDTFPTLGHNGTNGAVISITDFFAGDQLNFVNQNGITGNYNALTGVLTLSGIASLENYEAALQSITYSSVSANPANAGTDFVRTISWVAFDSANVSSDAVTSTVNIIGLAPEISNVGDTATYVTLGAPIVIESGIIITSVDYQTLHGATVSITSGLLTGDALNFTDQNGITGSYNSGLGVLTLTGDASFAFYQAALASITYSSSSLDPTNNDANPSRTITWVVDNGQVTNNLSDPVTSFIDINPPPVITAGGTITYFANDGPQPIEPALVITATGSQMISGAVVTISGGFDADDILAFTSNGSILGSYNSLLGILTLTGLDALANYQLALQSVTYESDSSDPTNLGTNFSRTISWQVTDLFNATSDIVTSTVEVRTPPIMAADDTIFYFAGDAPMVIDSDLTITAFESQTIIGAVVTITNDFDPQDILAFTTFGSIVGNYDSLLGILTFTGNASVEDYQSTLRSVTYESSSNDPTNFGNDLFRTINWQVTDNLNVSSAAATSLVAVWTPPTITVPPFEFYDHSLGVPSNLIGAVQITTVPFSDISELVITISDGFLFGDQLNVIDVVGDNITGVYDAVNGILTYSGLDSVANYLFALNFLTYSFSGFDPTNGGFNPFREFTWEITDNFPSTGETTNQVFVSFTPVVLDLSGDGIYLVSANDSQQTLGSLIGTDQNQSIGWITDGQGVLMLNSNGDGTITHSNQISFTSYVPGALTDLQGLAAFDTNHDNHLSAGDTAFTEFGVLLANGHFNTLSQLGITSISLISDNNFQTMNGNTIFGMTSYQTADGKTHQAADVALMIGSPKDTTLQTADVFPPQDNIDLTSLPPLQGSAAPHSDTTVTLTQSEASSSSPAPVVNTPTIEQIMPPMPQPEQPVVA